MHDDGHGRPEGDKDAHQPPPLSRTIASLQGHVWQLTAARVDHRVAEQKSSRRFVLPQRHRRVNRVRSRIDQDQIAQENVMPRPGRLLLVLNSPSVVVHDAIPCAVDSISPLIRD